MAKDTGTAPAPRSADKVRTVALVGHAGAGKTTLAEALLVATGALGRAGRVEDGTTCLDTEDVEIRQRRSVALGIATVEHAGHRITRFGADQLIKRAGRRVGITDVSANVLRRTHAAHARSEGDGDEEIRVRMGHRDVRTTRRYLGGRRSDPSA
jgi:integrase